MEVWDYFMRRKSLLLVILAFFFAGNFGYHTLRDHISRRETPRISISDWGAVPSDPIINIPHTGLSEPITASVMSPADLVRLPFENIESTVEPIEDVPQFDTEIMDEPTFADAEPGSESELESSPAVDPESEPPIWANEVLSPEAAPVEAQPELSVEDDAGEFIDLQPIPEATEATSGDSVNDFVSSNIDIEIPRTSDPSSPYHLNAGVSFLLGFCIIVVAALCSYHLYWRFIR